MVAETAVEQARAVEVLRGAFAREVDARGRLAGAVAASGEALTIARDLEVPWRQCQLAMGGLNRAAANARWRAARGRTGDVAKDAMTVDDSVLSGLAQRWGGPRPLRELQALEVAAECGARLAADAERAACSSEPGRRDYEIEDLAARVEEEAAESGRLALVRAARDREVSTLEAWRVVARAAESYRPLWRQ